MVDGTIVATIIISSDGAHQVLNTVDQYSLSCLSIRRLTADGFKR